MVRVQQYLKAAAGTTQYSILLHLPVEAEAEELELLLVLMVDLVAEEVLLEVQGILHQQTRHKEMVVVWWAHRREVVAEVLVVLEETEVLVLVPQVVLGLQAALQDHR